MGGEPRQFGPYRLVRRLGVGGMAETFEATRSGSGGFEQRVCLKRVLPAFCEDAELLERFQREAALAARLRHTNVVGVIDAGRVDGAQYMALELVDGVDLRSLLRSTPDERLAPDRVALIARDLAYALAHAHGTLVHRDISPSNILVARSGEIKLADFGVAKAIENRQATASRAARGKVPYMAPEHVRGEALDGRADLFSLGVVLFEALAGKRPFDGAHDVDTMQKILRGDRLPLAEAAPEVPPPLRAVVEHLIEVDLDERTASADALLDELAAIAVRPSVRRELAATVDALRGGVPARLHVRAREDERDTELSALPAPATGEPTSDRARPRRRLSWSLAVAILVGAAVAWPSIDVGPVPTPRVSDGATRSGDAPPAVEATAERNAATATPPHLDPAEEGVEIPHTPALAARRPAARERGVLEVVVEPWGNVWIDGQFMGRAPVVKELRNGRHTVEVGRDLRSRRQVVRVRPGERHKLRLTLTAE